MVKRYLSREELQSSQFAMLQEIHKVCTANNLRYYLAYGTLLGAVRHKGFIPWDDDVDIMMPVDDYLKLKGIYSSDRYFLSDCFHDKRHPAYFPRIYDSYTCREGDEKTLGVFIDIYLIHGAPKNQMECAKHIMKIMKTAAFAKWISKWRGRIVRNFLPFLWNQYESYMVTKFCQRIFNMLNKYKESTCEILYAYGGDGLTELFWKDYFEKTIFLPFNGAEFCVPMKYHEVLSVTYGNYMKLPPEDERHPYHSSNSFCWKTGFSD